MVEGEPFLHTDQSRWLPGSPSNSPISGGGLVSIKIICHNRYDLLTFLNNLIRLSGLIRKILHIRRVGASTLGLDGVRQEFPATVV